MRVIYGILCRIKCIVFRHQHQVTGQWVVTTRARRSTLRALTANDAALPVRITSVILKIIPTTQFQKQLSIRINRILRLLIAAKVWTHSVEYQVGRSFAIAPSNHKFNSVLLECKSLPFSEFLIWKHLSWCVLSAILYIFVSDLCNDMAFARTVLTYY